MCHVTSALKLCCFTDGANKAARKQLGGAETEKEQPTKKLQEKKSCQAMERYFICFL